jgi:hypothetical protein
LEHLLCDEVTLLAQISDSVSQFLFIWDFPVVGLLGVVLLVVVFHLSIFFMALSPIALTAVFSLFFPHENFIAITRSHVGMVRDLEQHSGILSGQCLHAFWHMGNPII